MAKIFLNYWKARGYAEKHHLKECAYGDSDENISYCAWNKSGDNYDEWEVEVYYKFAPEEVEKNGHRYTRYVPEEETSVDVLNWAKTVLGLSLKDIVGLE